MVNYYLVAEIGQDFRPGRAFGSTRSKKKAQNTASSIAYNIQKHVGIWEYEKNGKWYGMIDSYPKER